MAYPQQSNMVIHSLLTQNTVVTLSQSRANQMENKWTYYDIGLNLSARPSVRLSARPSVRLSIRPSVT